MTPKMCKNNTVCGTWTNIVDGRNGIIMFVQRFPLIVETPQQHIEPRESKQTGTLITLSCFI